MAGKKKAEPKKAPKPKALHPGAALALLVRARRRGR